MFYWVVLFKINFSLVRFFHNSSTIFRKWSVNLSPLQVSFSGAFLFFLVWKKYQLKYVIMKETITCIFFRNNWLHQLTKSILFSILKCSKRYYPIPTKAPSFCDFKFKKAISNETSSPRHFRINWTENKKEMDIFLWNNDLFILFILFTYSLLTFVSLQLKTISAS